MGELEPYWEALAGIAVDSRYNWYWLVDGLMEEIASRQGFDNRVVSILSRLPDARKGTAVGNLARSTSSILSTRG